ARGAAGQKVAPATVLLGADAKELAAAKLVKLSGLRLELRSVAFVGHANDWLGDIAKPAGYFFIQGRQTGTCVHYKKDHRRLFQRCFDLLFDLGGEVIDVLDTHPAGVYQFEEAILNLDQGSQSVTRDSGRRVNDGNALSSQPIKQRGLADVGAANDGNLGNGHVAILQSVAKARLSTAKLDGLVSSYINYSHEGQTNCRKFSIKIRT